MTEPTDAEIWQMWMPMVRRMGVADPVDFARAVLAKWGQPAQAEEPVAREPLTPEQRTAAFIRAEKKMQSDVNLSWRHALVDEIEAEHGIKGGQHGTDN